MTVRFPKHLLRLSVICLVLAIPSIIGVVVNVDETNRAVAMIERERTGLRCGIFAGNLLAAIERFRLDVLDPPPDAGRRSANDAIQAAFQQLQTAKCAPLVAGPRTGLTQLQTSGHAVLMQRAGVERARATLPLADLTLALFFDIEDASTLTYDPTVDAVNLNDALMARIPGNTERLDQSAQILQMAATRSNLTRPDIIAVERLLGRAHELGAMTDDDFGGDWAAPTPLRPALRAARAGATRAQSQLAARIERDIAGTGSTPANGDLRTLRLASISAGQQLLHVSERVLEMSFDARIAAYRRTAGLVIGGGAFALITGCFIVALLWRALRRHDRAELERAREREHALETTLARRNAERALHLTEQQFRAVFEASHVGIAIVDRDGTRLDANAALRAMFDDDPGLVVAKATLIFNDVIRENRDSHRTEHCFVKANGELLWTELSLSIIRGAPDEAISAIVLVHDITEHKTLNARLDHETLHDALTSLPNRVHFIRRLNTLMAAGNDGLAVAFIDLDRFKAVNDTLGHHAGDELLRLAGRRLTAAVRPTDFVARLHGDEFAVLLRDVLGATDLREIDAIVERLHAALEIIVETPTTPIRISASIGYVRDVATYADAEDILRDADSAMYRSKLGGRDRTTLHEPAASPVHSPKALRTAGM